VPNALSIGKVYQDIKHAVSIIAIEASMIDGTFHIIGMIALNMPLLSVMLNGRFPKKDSPHENP
jgi:hypothetical protein